MGVTKGSYGRGARAKATKLHSQIVRARGKCERCGASGEAAFLQCAHIVRRVHSHTRTDLGNAWCLCAKCHFKVDNDPWEFMELIRATCGETHYLGLREKAFTGVRVKFDWIQEVARLEAEWKAVNA